MIYLYKDLNGMVLAKSSEVVSRVASRNLELISRKFNTRNFTGRRVIIAFCCQIKCSVN